MRELAKGTYILLTNFDSGRSYGSGQGRRMFEGQAGGLFLIFGGFFSEQ